MAMEITVYDAFFGILFRSFHFHLSMLETMDFQDSTFEMIQ